MNFYLDVEFNGHGSPELISLAIAAPDGKHWYGIAGVPANPHPWVKEHVLPYLHAMDPTSAPFRASLHEYLASRAGNILYADWPDDFAHLMRVMSGPSYEQSFVVDIGMQLLAESDPKPAIPHNALSDAIALMEWHKLQGGF